MSGMRLPVDRPSLRFASQTTSPPIDGGEEARLQALAPFLYPRSAGGEVVCEANPSGGTFRSQLSGRRDACVPCIDWLARPRTASLIALLAIALFAGETYAADPRITLVRVDKSERRMELLAGDRIIRSYSIALGDNPVGHKRMEGDERTPEGRYMLDWRNPNSGYYRSIHISYPNEQDKATAGAMGVPPGGMIMIHGQPNGYGWWGWLFQMFDWTDGCIAVDNAAMAEIWKMVPNGTPIEISP
jgi:hypothetical protein